MLCDITNAVFIYQVKLRSSSLIRKIEYQLDKQSLLETTYYTV